MAKPGRPPNTYDPVDAHVGARIRLRRLLLGMSQTDLANALGLTWQQVQKYERGLNRVGASRLWQIAQVLDVPVSFFFDDMPVSKEGGRAPATEATLLSREAVEIGRLYDHAGPELRSALSSLVRAVSGQDRTTEEAA